MSMWSSCAAPRVLDDFDIPKWNQQSLFASLLVQIGSSGGPQWHLGRPEEAPRACKRLLERPSGDFCDSYVFFNMFCIALMATGIPKDVFLFNFGALAVQNCTWGSQKRLQGRLSCPLERPSGDFCAKCVFHHRFCMTLVATAPPKWPRGGGAAPSSGALVKR